MKKLMLSTAILGATTFAALAQDAASGVFRTKPDAQEILASEFIGKRVYASEAAVDADAYAGVQDGWEDLGEINDVILARDGTVSAVLVDIGGFLGIGERQVAVDMSAVRFVADDATADMPDDYFLVMNADRATIEAAPEYVGANATMAEPMADSTADATADTGGTALDDSADGVIAETTGADLAVDGSADAPMATEEMAEGDAAAAEPMTEPMTDGAADREMTMRDGYGPATTEVLTTERLTGAAAYDTNDENIGTVAELVIDADGQITEAVIDVGGFLGIGAKPVALPLDQIDILLSDAGDDLRVYVPMTKEQLEALPRYEG